MPPCQIRDRKDSKNNVNQKFIQEKIEGIFVDEMWMVDLSLYN